MPARSGPRATATSFRGLTFLPAIASQTLSNRRLPPEVSTVNLPAQPPDALADARGVGRRYLACSLICAVLAVAALQVDVPLRNAVSEAGTLNIPGDVRRLVTLAEVFAHGFGVAACIAVAVALDRRGWRIAPRLAIGAFGAGLLADVCKLQVARVRPKFAGDNLASVGDTFLAIFPWYSPEQLGRPLNNAVRSFPSGHTATAVGFAIVLSSLYPRGRWLFALFAALAAFQRIESGMHYLSDTLAAASIGFLVGAAVCGRTKLHARLERLEMSPSASVASESFDDEPQAARERDGWRKAG